MTRDLAFRFVLGQDFCLLIFLVNFCCESITQAIVESGRDIIWIFL